MSTQAIRVTYHMILTGLVTVKLIAIDSLEKKENNTHEKCILDWKEAGWPEGGTGEEVASTTS